MNPRLKSVPLILATEAGIFSYGEFGREFGAEQELTEMSEATENGQPQSNTPAIYGRELNMAELAEATQEYGRKIVDAASRAGDFVSDKVGVVGDKIKDLQGKDIGEIADEAKDYARKNPGQVILISAVAGVVLGFLLRGRR
jgi:ElaB/YqjD/DUF883 family membrane-anchored ribosome-binding protein